ncbi:MAG: biotin/lipoyl-containing protein [Desulfitobacteriaceae bacterium]
MKRFNITVNSLSYEVEVEEVFEDKPRKKVPVAAANPKQHAVRKESGGVSAPMPGVITEIHIRIGDLVSTDQPVLILEAMKMENEILAGKNGEIKEILVESGQKVAAGDLLIVIE